MLDAAARVDRNDQPALPSESTLFKDLSKIAHPHSGWRVVHILSSSVACADGFEKMIAAVIEAVAQLLVSARQSKIYRLSNGDIVFIYTQLPTPKVQGLCNRIEATLFKGMPALPSAYGEVGHWKLFDAGRDAQRIMHAVRSGTADQRPRMVAKPPLPAEQLGFIFERLRQTNIRSLVFNQPIYNIEHEVPSIEFLEFYTSIQKVEETFVPAYSITADPFVFNIVKRELDAAVLRVIGDDIGEYRHAAFSINLLAETFMSDTFRHFLEGLPTRLRRKVYAEIDKSEWLHHGQGIDAMLERSKELDVPLCCDGLSHGDTRMMKLSAIPARFIKMKWQDEILRLPPDRMEVLVRDLKAVGSNVVLTWCDRKLALSFAKTVGIRYVQGRLADKFFRDGAPMT